MSTPAFPISVLSVHFTRSCVVAIPEFNPQTTTPIEPPKNNINVEKIDGGHRRYLATMTSTINTEHSPEYPYFIDMQCVALFEADDQLDDAGAMRGITITAHSVLYGAIREAVSWITARQPYGPVLLGLSVLNNSQPSAENP